MSPTPQHADLGKPALRIAGFQLWIHTRPHSVSREDPYDCWLAVTAHCGAAGSSVWTFGENLLLTEIEAFGDACASLARRERSTAALAPLEPGLDILLESVDGSGHVRLRVEITPDPHTQAHSFEFDIDQTYLPDIARQCAAIVVEFQSPRAGSEPRR